MAPLTSAYQRQRSLPLAGSRQSACIVTVFSIFCYIPAFSKDIYDIYSFNLKHSPCIQHLAVHRMQENTQGIKRSNTYIVSQSSSIYTYIVSHCSSIQIKTKTKHQQSINASFHEVNQICKIGIRKLEEEEEEEEEEEDQKKKKKKKKTKKNKKKERRRIRIRIRRRSRRWRKRKKRKRKNKNIFSSSSSLFFSSFFSSIFLSFSFFFFYSFFFFSFFFYSFFFSSSLFFFFLFLICVILELTQVRMPFLC